MNNMRRGFTMIELIFVIVIIGILAAVAIPKLAATRDNAENAKSCANAATCLTELAASFTATGTADSATPACASASGYLTIGTQSASYDGSISNCNLSTATMNFGGSSTSI